MCRDWRRCPSSRGERKRAYQRARYAAKKAEREHASSASSGLRGAGDASVSEEVAAAMQSTAGAHAIAKAYHAPETTSVMGGYAATSAIPASAVAGRLNDPEDPLYIDPDDTSQAAATARDGVITLLSSSDLSDTRYLDARVAAACDPAMREVVARAGQERALALHKDIEEFTAAGGRSKSLEEMATIQGRALSVSSGLRESVNIDEYLDNRYKKYPHNCNAAVAAGVPEYRTLMLAGTSTTKDMDPSEVDAAVETVLVDAMSPNYAGYTSRVEFKNLDDEGRHKLARTIVEAVHEVGDGHSPLLRRGQYEQDVEAILETDKKLEKYLSQLDNPESFEEALDTLDKIMGTPFSSNRRFDGLGLTMDFDEKGVTPYQHYARRCKKEGIKPVSKDEASRAAGRVALLNSLACAYSDVSCFPDVKDAEGDYDKHRLKEIRRSLSYYSHEGTSNEASSPWSETVRSCLNELSPRYEPDRKDELHSLMYHSSQARKRDSDGIGVAASMYSKETMDAVVEGMNERGRKIYVERSKKRAHYQSFGRKEVTSKTEKEYPILTPRSLVRDDNGQIQDVEEVGFVHMEGSKISDDYAARYYSFDSKEEAQKLADEYNSLDVSKRTRLVRQRKKSGFTMVVEEVQRKGEDEPRYILRSTSGTGRPIKYTEDVSTIRVDGSSSTTHHEVAHWVDDYSVANNDMAQDLLSQRTEGLSPTVYSGHANEQVVKDGFYNEYVGKTSYGTRASEINSMGVEVLLHNPIQSQSEDEYPVDNEGRVVASTAPSLIDPDHHAHTLGMLAGSVRPKEYNNIHRWQTKTTAEEKRKALEHNKRAFKFAKEHPELEKNLTLRLVSVLNEGDTMQPLLDREGRGNIEAVPTFMLSMNDPKSYKDIMDLQNKWLSSEGDKLG